MARMIRFRQTLYVFLIVLAGFLGLSAVPGGIMLLVGFYSPPVEQLSGSVFSDFTIPGLSLLFIVGGSSVLATVLLIRRSPFAVLAAAFAGLAVMCFELVEILAIGSPPGPVRAMQILYFGIGAALVAASLGVLLVDVTQRLAAPGAM
jgi:hypothetical protein